MKPSLLCSFCILIALALFGCGSPSSVRFQNDCPPGGCLTPDGDSEPEPDLVDGDSETDSAEADSEAENDTPNGPTRLSCAENPKDWLLLFHASLEANRSRGYSSGVSLYRAGPDEVYLVGTYSTHIELGQSGLSVPVPEACQSGSSAFVGRFDRDGNNLWGLDHFARLGACSYSMKPASTLMPDGRLAFWGMTTFSQSYPHANASGMRLHYVDKTGKSEILAPLTEFVTFVLAGDAYGNLFSGTSDLSKSDAQGQPIWDSGIVLISPKSGDNEYGGITSQLVPLSDGGVLFASAVDQGFAVNRNTVLQETHNKTWDLALVRLDAAGHYQWSTMVGSAGQDWSGSVALDEAGDIYASLGCAEECIPGDSNSKGSVLAKISGQGAILWVRRTGDFMERVPYWLARDKAGRFFQSASGRLRQLDAEGRVLGEYALPKAMHLNALVPDEAGGLYATGYTLYDQAVSEDFLCGQVGSPNESEQAFLMHIDKIPPLSTPR